MFAHKISLFLAGKSGVTLFAPTDIEGHLGSDGRYYLLGTLFFLTKGWGMGSFSADFSRTFPPAPDGVSRKAPRGAHLYRLLRPELVSSSAVALSSDANTEYVTSNMSGGLTLRSFGYARENTEVHNRDIRKVWEYLMNERIPSFVQEWEENIQKMRRHYLEFFQKNLPAHLHLYGTILNRLEVIEYHVIFIGINLRLMGYVRKASSNPQLREALLIEMIARWIKKDMERTLREMMKSSQPPTEVL